MKTTNASGQGRALDLDHDLHLDGGRDPNGKCGQGGRRVHSRRHLLGAALLSALLLAACGGKVSGVYSGKDTGMLDQLEFKGDGKVELSFMGTVQEGSYVVEQGRVKISSAGSGTQIFRIDDKGCLDGGGLLGKYCKA